MKKIRGSRKTFCVFNFTDLILWKGYITKCDLKFNAIPINVPIKFFTEVKKNTEIHLEPHLIKLES